MDNSYIDYNKYINIKNSKKLNILTHHKVKKHNKNYIRNMVKKDLSINNCNLDICQKEAVFTDEVNTLVLAGAGSGKTLTIIAKIKYLIEEKHIPKEEILCLSFTNETVKNLKEKVEYDIDIFTFHKLAIEIINDYKIYYNISSSDYLEYIINEVFLSLCSDLKENDLRYFAKRISSFINIFKVNNYDINILKKLSKKNNKLLKVIIYIYYIYENELSSSISYDFNDLINKASYLIQKYGLKRYYKYVIVDEFQDISNSRYELVKQIKNSCNAHLFAVGDDFQSIYRFAGSRLELITNFKKYFGYTRVVKLLNTYRNSNELIMAASLFVLKNGNQIKKRLRSSKKLYKPIKIVYYEKNMEIKLRILFKTINTKVLVLSRNNYDEKIVKEIDDNIIFKTIHKSKGLEEENVIVLGLFDGYFGFPSKQEDELNKLLIKKENCLYEEERRLFYVALTRTKNYVYLFVDKSRPSIFIKELFKTSRRYIEVLDL